MKLLGLITEYNPFHNGHLYHLEKSKEITGASHTVAVMSGNFLQRGEPALLNKWLRGKMAVKAGVDLVIELPTAYACSTAEFFAYGAVSMLHNLGAVDALCFGSEYGDISLLDTIADVLLTSPTNFKLKLKEYLSSGIPFPVARSKALVDYIQGSSNDNHLCNIEDIMNSPNNILSIEYIKSLKKLNSSISPYTITRIKAAYHSKDISDEISSATAIRQALYEGISLEGLSQVIPSSSHKIMQKSFEENLAPIFKEDYEKALLTILRRMNTEEFTDFFDVGEGLEHKIAQCSESCSSIEELYHCIKSKRYTLTRIQRICMHILINLKKHDIISFNETGGPQYARVLAFNDKGREILKVFKESSRLPIITKLSKYTTQNTAAEKMIQLDIRATNIYSMAFKNDLYRKKSLDYYISPYYKSKA